MPYIMQHIDVRCCMHARAHFVQNTDTVNKMYAYIPYPRGHRSQTHLRFHDHLPDALLPLLFDARRLSQPASHTPRRSSGCCADRTNDTRWLFVAIKIKSGNLDMARFKKNWPALIAR